MMLPILMSILYQRQDVRIIRVGKDGVYHRGECVVKDKESGHDNEESEKNLQQIPVQSLPYLGRSLRSFLFRPKLDGFVLELDFIDI